MSRKKSTIDDLFSERLKILIEDTLGVSQKYFAEKIGISESYISAILKKRRGLSAELIVGLYVHYSKYLDWLLTGDREMTRQGPECDTCIYNKVGMLEDDPETIDLVTMCWEILKSNTGYTNSLAANIRSFHQAMQNEKRINGLEHENVELKKRISVLEKRMSKDEQRIREGDDEAQRGEILKKRRA